VLGRAWSRLTSPARAVTCMALVLLIVNDHVLKAMWGTWWTGKLSDAAWLVVGPPLLATIMVGAGSFVGVRRPSARSCTRVSLAVVGASSYNPEILGDLELSSFTSGDGWAESVATMGDLKVTHHFRPSADPNLFALDVTVVRVAPAAPSSGHVTYRRTMEWGDSMWQEYLTWARSPDGNESAVSTLTDARSAPGPTYEAMVNDTAGYVDRAGPFYVGGETIDLDLGPVVPGSSVTFTLLCGATLDAAHAAAAAAAVDADVYSLIETSEPGVSTTAVSPTAPASRSSRQRCPDRVRRRCRLCVPTLRRFPGPSAGCARCSGARGRRAAGDRS